MSNCDGKGAAALSIAEHSLSTYSEVAEGYFGALPDKCGAWWTIGENAITSGLLSSKYLHIKLPMKWWIR